MPQPPAAWKNEEGSAGEQRRAVSAEMTQSSAAWRHEEDSAGEQRRAEFCEVLDRGLHELRCSLLRAVTQSLMVERSPSTHCADIESSPPISQCADTKESSWNLGAVDTLAGYSVCGDSQDVMADSNGEVSLPMSKIADSRVSEHSSIDSSSGTFVCTKSLKTTIDKRWSRLVQLVMKVGSGQFHILSCWAPAQDDPLLPTLVRASVNQVGGQQQMLDDIIIAFLNKKNGITSYGKLHSAISLSSSNGYVLHPLSTFRIAWSLMGLVCIAYDAIMISLNVFDLGTSSVQQIIDWSLRVFWMLDIVVSFFTGFYVKNRYEGSLREVAKKYLTTWFFIDLIAVVPDVMFALIESNSNVGDYSQTFRYLKILKILRLARVAKMAYWAQSFLNSINSINFALFAHVLKYAILMMLWVHFCGCGWYAIAKYGEDDNWLVTNNIKDATVSQLYFISLQWACAQLQGSTDLVPSVSVVERAASCLVILVSIFVLTVFISHITNALIQLQNAWDGKARHLRALQDYLHRHRISQELSENVRKYCEEKLRIERKLHFGEDDVTKMLPKVLRRALLVEVRAKVVKENNPMFVSLDRAHPRIFEQLCCDILTPVFVGPDTLVYHYGEECNTTYFNVAGHLLYDHVDNFALNKFMTHVRRRTVNFGVRDAHNKTTTTSDLSKLANSGTCDSIQAPFHALSATRSMTRPSVTRPRATMQKTILRERLKESGLLKSIKLDSLQSICEASLWTSWSHCGDLRAVSHMAFLTIECQSFSILVENDTLLQKFGVSHAVRFCRLLNDADHSRSVSDLLTSYDVLDAFLKAGELGQARRKCIHNADEFTAMGGMDSSI